MVLEVIYNPATRLLIAAQEIDREIHDWELQHEQAFIKIEGKLPPGDISQNMLSSDLKTLIPNPDYEDPLSKLQDEWDTQQQQISTANTVDDIKPLLSNLLGDRPK